MQKICPHCGCSVDAANHFCSNCGCVMPTEPVQPAYRNPAPMTNPYAADPEIQPATAPAKKSKAGLIIGICAAAVVAAVAVILLFLFVFGSGAAIRNAFKKQDEAYAKADFETYYGYDYDIVFGEKDALENAVKNEAERKQLYPEDYENEAASKYRILAIESLSKDGEAKAKSILKKNGFRDTDSIQDIKAVLYEYTNDKLENDYGVFSCYAIKENGKWYFLYGDLVEYEE